MKIKSAHLYRYKLPLQLPIPFAGQFKDYREGFIIELETFEGEKGYGEIAPVPGWVVPLDEKAIIEQISAIINAWQPLLENQSVRFPNTFRDLNIACEGFSPHPTVYYGLESALLNLLAVQKNISLALILNKNHAPEFRINGFLTGEPSEQLQVARSLFARGYRTFKLKVGKLASQTEAEVINQLVANLNGNLKLRLDANRAFEYQEAVQLLSEISDLSVIEYMEEPLKDPQLFEVFHRETGVPIALDETLSEEHPETLKPLEGLAAIILKPSVLGGIFRSWRWARWGRQRGIYAVVSCPFETAVGWTMHAHFSAALNEPSVAMGLDTLKCFPQQLITRDVQWEADVIRVDRLPPFISGEIREEFLKMVHRF